MRLVFVVILAIFFATTVTNCDRNAAKKKRPDGSMVDFSKRLGLNKKDVERFYNEPTRHVNKPNTKAKKIKRNLFRKKRQTITDTSFDWRDWTYCRSLTDIRLQACTNCWASSAAIVMSDRHCLLTGENRFFSEAETTTCAIVTGGCNGGSANKAFNYYTQYGICTGGDDYVLPLEPLGCVPKSYLLANSRCPTKCINGLVVDAVIGSDADYLRNITALNITMATRIAIMKQEIYDYGPVVVYIQAYADFVNYTGGVYVHNPKIKCQDGTTWCGHAIRVIGWGIENNVPYWLCVNQWGLLWGDISDPGTIKVKQGVTDQSGVDWFAAWAYPQVP